MEKVRGTESKEKSFLKNVVGKRLEEMASSQSRVDPLELLGISSPVISVPSAPTLPVESSVEIPTHVGSVVSPTPSERHRMTTSTAPETSARSISSAREADGETAALSEYSDSVRARSDSSKTRAVHSESHTVRNTVSGTDSLAPSRPTPIIQRTHEDTSSPGGESPRHPCFSPQTTIALGPLCLGTP